MSQPSPAYQPCRPDGILELTVDELYTNSDFTYYLLAEEIKEQLNQLRDPKRKPTDPPIPEEALPYSVECTVRLTKGGTSSKPSLSGRANLTKCYGGKWFALTVRKERAEGGLKDIFNSEKKPARNPALKSKRGNGWHVPPGLKKGAGEFLFAISELCEALAPVLSKAEAPHSGLIVVSGSTNSAKSMVARGLMVELLHDKPCDKRRHHVITLEDPPERVLLGSLEKDDCIK